MEKLSRTWWGQRFLQALERCTDPGRLQRGRSYAKPTRLLAFTIDGHTITSRIRGNVNPYYGVYEEPRYDVEISLRIIPDRDWIRIINSLTRNAGWLSRLLLNEMPDDIENAFMQSRRHLLPASEKDLHTHCTCPDWANPCKHVAGTYYHVARLLDQDPFLLFQLRGLGHDRLQRELKKSPLGQALAEQSLSESDIQPEAVANRYPQTPRLAVEDTMTHKAFWCGSSLPEAPRTGQAPRVPALLIKKQGDYPAFWDRDNSFLEAMEQIYEHVRLKNKDSL
jgi:uncharacterized Zn finger protein